VDNVNELQNLIEEAKVAISDVEGSDAKKILKKMDTLLAGQNINSDAYARLENLKTNLRIVAFPNLSDEESADVLRYHILESLDIDVPMENLISAKLFLVPYLVRDELREKLKRALMGNNQRLGEMTIGQWIHEFESDPNFHGNTSSTVQFVMQNPKAQRLSSLDKKKLKEIIHIYNYYLVATLPATGAMLNEILAGIPEIQAPVRGSQVSYAPVRPGERRYPIQEEAARREIRRPMSLQGSAGTGTVNLSINEALQKYPNLGEQLLSANPLKLKFLPQTVRPSIKNWITDYHETLGAGRHETMDRGNFLYHSDNAKKLTSGERQKLATVLKAVDENLQIKVDLGRQEMLFQEQELASTPPETRQQEPKISQAPARIGNQRVQSSYAPASRIQPAGREPQKTFARQEPQYIAPKPQSWQSERNPYQPRPTNRSFSAPSPSVRNFGQAITDSGYRPQPRDNFRTEEKRRDTNHEEMRFSSPQRLPSEKSDPHSRYRISPIGSGYDDIDSKPNPKVDGNIVDLSGRN
jgi:hypothetical protein